MEHGRAQVADCIFFSTMFGFGSGVVFGSFTMLPIPMQICIGIIAVISLVCSVLSKQLRLLCLALGVFLILSLAGMWRADATKPDAGRFSSVVGSTVEIVGIVRTEPALKNGSQKFTLTLDALPGRGPLSMLVTARSEPRLLYGDRIVATGVLAIPENFMTDQGSEFDYVSYLYKDTILYQLKNAKVTIESHGHGNWVLAQLMRVRASIVRSYRRVLPSREADLLAGINLGEKSSIDPDFRNDLVTTGTIHMIALSGYNVTILANALRDFFVGILKLSGRTAAVGGGLCIVLFVAMTGLQSSAVRAGIMALIGLFARTRGRTYDAFRALIFSGFLMVLYNPKYLPYDASFALSFLATLGIIFLTPLLDRLFVHVPTKLLWVLPLREALSVTLGAQIGVLPYILYKMGTLSIISLPVNILVLPAVPFSMALGEVAGLFGSFSTGLAQPFAVATHVLLQYIIGTISFFAKVPYAAVMIRQFPLWLCLVSYAGLIWFVFYKRKAYSAGKSNVMSKLTKSTDRTQIHTGAIANNVGASFTPTRNGSKVFLESPAEKKVFVPLKKVQKKKK